MSTINIQTVSQPIKWGSIPVIDSDNGSFVATLLTYESHSVFPDTPPPEESPFPVALFDPIGQLPTLTTPASQVGLLDRFNASAARKAQRYYLSACRKTTRYTTAICRVPGNLYRVRYYYRWFKDALGIIRIVPEHAEESSAALINEANDVCEREDVPAPTTKDFPRPDRRNFMVELATQSRLKFGLRVRSEANRIIVQQFMLGLCTERGLRQSHAAAIIPMAIELAFTPTIFEVEAVDFANSIAVRKRHRDYEMARDQHQSLLGWLLRRGETRDVSYRSG